MEKVSIKTNFAYQTILMISSYVMSFITFPYIARIFGPERIGFINFADNVVNYFLLFAMMGIGTLGVREIAIVKDHVKDRSRVFGNLLGLNLLFTTITLVVYYLVISYVPRFYQHVELFYIGAAKILFTTFLVEWFFTGIENFKYITIRTLIVKTSYVVAVFLCIKERDHYFRYWLLTVGVVVINALVNMISIRKYITIQLSDLIDWKYFRSNITLGVYALLTSMYSTFNVLYLGLVSTDTEVGYYTTAYKLYAIVLGIFSAFSTVMLPRMNSLLAGGDIERWQKLIDKSFSAIIAVALPLVLCSIVLAPQIIEVISGVGYEGAIVPMRIIMPALLLVGLSQVMTLQVLIPLKKDRVLLNTSIIGAFVSFVANFILVRTFQSVGSAVVLLIAEMLVTMIYVVYVRCSLAIHIPIHIFVKELFLTLPPTMICLAVCGLFETSVVSLSLAIPLALAVWVAMHHNRLKRLVL